MDTDETNVEDDGGYEAPAIQEVTPITALLGGPGGSDLTTTIN